MGGRIGGGGLRISPRGKGWLSEVPSMQTIQRDNRFKRPFEMGIFDLAVSLLNVSASCHWAKNDVTLTFSQIFGVYSNSFATRAGKVIKSQ